MTRMQIIILLVMGFQAALGAFSVSQLQPADNYYFCKWAIVAITGAAIMFYFTIGFVAP